MTNNSALKDDLCSYLPSLDTYMRAGYIGVVLAPPTSLLQEEYVLQSLGDRSQDVREEAYKALSEMTLSPEQNQKVEELLRFKYSEMRIHAINLLMKQPKEQLSGSIRRLLTDKVAERRLAGLDMMKTIHNVEFLQDIYQELIPTVKEIQKPNPKEKVLIELAMEQKRASHNIIPKITVSVCTIRLLKSVCRKLPRTKDSTLKKHSNSSVLEGPNSFSKN